MTTLQFLNERSTGIIDQSTWDDDVNTNEYYIKKTDKNEFNDFNSQLYLDKECEYVLKSEDISRYELQINELDIDVIDNILLKMKVSNEMYKLLFSSYYITIMIPTRSDSIKLVDSSLLNICLISHFNNYNIEEDENIITVPLIQFNHLEYGYLYRELKRKKIYILFRCYSNTEFKLVKFPVLDEIKVIFNGKKYYDYKLLDIKEKYYKPIDMNWTILEYNIDGNYISRISTQYQFLTFSLIKNFMINDISVNDINEYINNQPEIEEIIFQHENTVPWVYDLKYMKKIVICDINVYILPLYPEFINTDNMIYYMKNSSNGIEPYIEPYKIIIKTNIIPESYNLYIGYFGEWCDDD